MTVGSVDDLWDNCWAPGVRRKKPKMKYTIYTGKFETGTPEQQGAYTQLFGAENIQYKFDLYFHWYNILHEYGHCLCDYYKTGTDDLKEELLVNRFAVSICNQAGFEKELKNLKAMLDEILDRIKSPVPAHMSFVDFYGQIWGTDQLMDVAVYGYFQFESVRMALEEKEILADVLREMGIHGKTGIYSKTEIHQADTAPVFFNKEYTISARTAQEVLGDVRQFLNGMGIEQPEAEVDLVDDPMIQCAQKKGSNKS